MFSLEQLLFAIANDQRSKDETIKKILPMLKEASDAEKIIRQALKVRESCTCRFLDIKHLPF
jgi:protein Jumonji